MATASYFKAYQPAMRPMHCKVLWHLTLTWFIHPSKSSLGEYSETIHGSSFRFSGNINLTKNLWHCQDILTYCPSAMKIWPSPWILMATASYIEGIWTCHCATAWLFLTFWTLTLTLWPLPWKWYLPYCSKTYIMRHGLVLFSVHNIAL